jgi:hypothetical protein
MQKLGARPASRGPAEPAFGASLARDAASASKFVAEVQFVLDPPGPEAQA